MRKDRRARRGPPQRVPPITTDSYFARAGRGGISDLHARTPELLRLHDKTVVVAGLGGLGAPSAMEFARAGVAELRLADSDFVDPGTSVRWPLGLAAAGLQKTEALRSFIAANWPYTRVSVLDHRFGAIRVDRSERPEQEVVTDLLNGASLVYDATAEMGVAYFLSDMARQRGLDYVCLWTAPGAWSGIVARISPDSDQPCWLCFRYALDEGSLPALPFDDQGEVQPIGCADPTFTGAGFDVAAIALMGVRLAVSTMSEGTDGGYPRCDWDVAILRHRSDRAAIQPGVATFRLSLHPSCPVHGAKSSG